MNLWPRWSNIVLRVRKGFYALSIVIAQKSILDRDQVVWISVTLTHFFTALLPNLGDNISMLHWRSSLSQKSIWQYHRPQILLLFAALEDHIALGPASVFGKCHKYLTIITQQQAVDSNLIPAYYRTKYPVVNSNLMIIFLLLLSPRLR